MDALSFAVFKMKAAVLAAALAACVPAVAEQIWLHRKYREKRVFSVYYGGAFFEN